MSTPSLHAFAKLKRMQRPSPVTQIQDALQAPPQIQQRATGWPFPKACDVLLGTPGLVGSVFSKQRNREFKLKYLKRLSDANNLLCPGGAWKGRVSSGYSGVGSAISVFVVHFFLITKNAEGWAVCVHMDLLLEEAIVTHLVSCHGRE